MTTTDRLAYRVQRNDRVRHGRRTWRVQAVDLIAVIPRRRGDPPRDPRLRFTLTDGRGHHVRLTKEQTDTMKVVAA